MPRRHTDYREAKRRSRSSIPLRRSAGFSLVEFESKYDICALEALRIDGVSNSNYSALAVADLDPSNSMLNIRTIESGLIVRE